MDNESTEGPGQFTAQPHFYPIFSAEELSHVGFGVVPYVKVNDSKFRLRELVRDQNSENTNLDELVRETLQQAVEQLTYFLRQQDDEITVTLEFPSDLFTAAESDIVKLMNDQASKIRENTAGQERSRMKLIVGLNKSSFNEIDSADPDTLEHIKQSGFNFVLEDYRQEEIPMMRLNNSPVKMISISGNTIDKLDDKPEFFRNLTTYAHSIGLDIHLTDVSERTRLQNALDWNFNYVSGELLGDVHEHLQDVSLTANYSYQIDDLASNVQTNEDTLEKTTLIGKPYTLIISGADTPGDILSLPLSYKKVPHRACHTIDEARRNIKKFEFDLIIVSACDFDREELLTLFEETGERLGKTPRLIILEEHERNVGQFTEEDQINEVIQQPVHFPKYLRALERLTLRMKHEGAIDVDHTSKHKNKWYSKRVSLYAAALLLAVLVGLSLGPTIDKLNAVTEQFVDETNYLVKSVEDIKGYLERDEQRDIRRR